MPHHFRMGRYSGLLLTMSFIFSLAFFNKVAGQNNSPKPVYVTFTYIKTFPGKFDQYDSLLSNYTKKVFNQEIKDGHFYEWSTYEVLMPSGASAEYDVVGVSVTDKIDLILDPPGTSKEMLAKVFPDMGEAKSAQVMKDYADCRTIVRKEVYMVDATTGKDDGPPTSSPAKYAQINFMTPVAGKEDAYEKMERVTFKPVHIQRIKMNALKGWALLRKMLPSDTEDHSPFMTVDFYDDFSGMMDGKYDQAIKAAYPTSDANKMFQSIGAVKKGQRTEVWKLMMHSE